MQQQPQRVARASCIAAFISLSLMAIVEAHGIATSVEIGDNGILLLDSILKCVASVACLVLLALACRRPFAHRLPFCLTLLVLFVAPQAHYFSRWLHSGITFEVLVSMLTASLWSVCVTCPLIVLVCIAHVARRENREARGEI
jgi:hypothetical protein